MSARGRAAQKSGLQFVVTRVSEIDLTITSDRKEDANVA